jgi:hypothetical protein
LLNILRLQLRILELIEAIAQGHRARSTARIDLQALDLVIDDSEIILQGLGLPPKGLLLRGRDPEYRLLIISPAKGIVEL